MTPWRYLVIMKGLPGEYRALARLQEDVASGVTPLIQLWDRVPVTEIEVEPDDLLGAETLALIAEQAPLWRDPPGLAIWDRLRKELLSKIRDGSAPINDLLLDGEWLSDPGAFGAVLDQ